VCRGWPLGYGYTCLWALGAVQGMGACGYAACWFLTFKNNVLNPTHVTPQPANSRTLPSLCTRRMSRVDLGLKPS
jgi:hypothetical protein